MDNQKPVLQIEQQEPHKHFIAIYLCIWIILVSAGVGVFHYFYATLCVLSFVSLILFVNYNDIKRMNKKTNIMNFYANGKIEYNHKIFNAEDYLGIITINCDVTYPIYHICRLDFIVLINKNKCKDNLYVFRLPVYSGNDDDDIEFNEIIQLKKNISNVIHKPIFQSCENVVLRDNLKLWQENDINHLILYNQNIFNQMEVILYCFLVGLFVFSMFSNYNLYFTYILTILSVISLYFLFKNHSFHTLYNISNIFKISQIEINNEELLYNNKEIALSDIKQIKIKDIYSQKYYIYSRLNIELNNGEIIKLFVSTPQVRNPEKLRQFLSEKLPNKLIDEDKIF
ncbi:MAG: hypothetical protein IJV35_06910 [Neisseriaceae bacterium]|nr:hypothetical protein [Neisseriaceae bacterium]